MTFFSLKNWTMITSSFALAILLFNSCKKDDKKNPCPQPNCIDCCVADDIAALKEWYYYKVGTYWIYEEATTHVLDTVLVFHHDDDVFDYGDAFKTECFNGAETTGYSGFEFSESWSTPGLANPDFVTHKVSRSRTRSDATGGAARFLLFPMYVGNYSYPDGKWAGITNIFDSLHIGNFDFHQVVQIDVPDDDCEMFSQTQYLVVKHVGIVRLKNLTTDEEWNLIEYHTEQ
jgi:hypothetical protein